MKTNARNAATGSVCQYTRVLVAGLLLGVGWMAHAQTTQVPPTATPTPPTSVGATGKPPVGPVQSKVLADPDTKMYSVCTTGGEHDAPGDSEPSYKPPPKAVVITEDEAKSRGYRAGAHKVACK